MTTLTDMAIEMIRLIGEGECIQKSEAEYSFIERLTFSSAAEITAMLNTILKGDTWILMPVWARNLSFRLACLLEADNVELLRRAAADIRHFGPDWDTEADRLEREADAIEGTMSQ